MDTSSWNVLQPQGYLCGGTLGTIGEPLSPLFTGVGGGNARERACGGTEVVASAPDNSSAVQASPLSPELPPTLLLAPRLRTDGIDGQPHSRRFH